MALDCRPGLSGLSQVHGPNKDVHQTLTKQSVRHQFCPCETVTYKNVYFMLHMFTVYWGHRTNNISGYSAVTFIYGYDSE